MRLPIYREKIVALLKKRHLLSIAEIQTHLPEADNSTIYRNTEHLVSEGVLRKIVLDKRRTLYEVVEREGEHGHFWCTLCDTIASIPLPSVQSTTPTQIVHDMLVRGICGRCSTQG